MRYTLVLHDVSRPRSLPGVVQSRTPFSPLAAGDLIQSPGHPLQEGVTYRIARLEHSFPTGERGGLFHQVDAYLVPE